MRGSVAKWGNSLALRLPRTVASDAGLHEGMVVDISVAGDAVVVKRARPHYRLADLLRGATKRNRHAEADWGAPQGKEEW